MHGTLGVSFIPSSASENRFLFTGGKLGSASEFRCESDISDQGVLDPGMIVLQKPFTQESLAGKVRETLDKEAPLRVT